MAAEKTEPYEEQVAQVLRELGIPVTHGKKSGLRIFHEAAELVTVGADIYGREQKLAPKAAAAWRALKLAAEHDGIALLLVSAFRSFAYQRQIIERKLAAGISLEQILRVSAAPGYSEHHTGRAVDVTAPNCKPLTEEFEHTSTFVWLGNRARDFGFTMTYPRNNKFGVVYEPWHWVLEEPTV
jgi:zinc D-Ala-D-Ala carboxypeptidase